MKYFFIFLFFTNIFCSDQNEIQNFFDNIEQEVTDTSKQNSAEKSFKEQWHEFWDSYQKAKFFIETICRAIKITSKTSLKLLQEAWEIDRFYQKITDKLYNLMFFNQHNKRRQFIAKSNQNFEEIKLETYDIKTSNYNLYQEPEPWLFQSALEKCITNIEKMSHLTNTFIETMNNKKKAQRSKLEQIKKSIQEQEELKLRKNQKEKDHKNSKTKTSENNSKQKTDKGLSRLETIDNIAHGITKFFTKTTQNYIFLQNNLPAKNSILNYFNNIETIYQDQIAKSICNLPALDQIINPFSKLYNIHNSSVIQAKETPYAYEDSTPYNQNTHTAYDKHISLTLHTIPNNFLTKKAFSIRFENIVRKLFPLFKKI